MSATPFKDAITANATAADTIKTLSDVYLGGIQNLSALNFDAAREAIDDFTTATKTLSEAKESDQLKNLPSVLGAPMWEKTAAYTRSAYEIITKTQAEISKLTIGQLSQPNMPSNVPASWTTVVEMFTKGFQQYAASATENVRAFSDAGSKVAATTTSYVKKSA